MALQHFILTRFNLLLWQKDKEGQKVRTTEWLEHRFSLFERYCLPSVMGQSCQTFSWIVLFDIATPERFRRRIEDYQKKCPQLIPVFVERENSRKFAQVFRNEVIKRLAADRVITTYLDNDDAISVRFVEDLQQRSETIDEGTFIYYSDGYQLYANDGYLMQIHYPNNHFVSVVEQGLPTRVKTIYGYGSHYYIDRIQSAVIERIAKMPMWCEVVHDKNVDNDAYYFRSKMISDEMLLKRDFALNETIRHGWNLYLFRFLPRYAKMFIRRTKHYLFGRKW